LLQGYHYYIKNNFLIKVMMQHKNWKCSKCSNREYEIGEMRVTGSFWTKIFNIQNKKYSSVSCLKCSYTEFYKNPEGSTLSNIFDFFTN